MEVGSSFWRRVVLFLFVCWLLLLLFFFSTPKVGDYFVFLSLTSGWEVFLFFCFVFCFCFVLFCFVLFCFSFKMFNFPTIYLGSGWFFFFFFFFLSRRLVKFFAFFYFCLFVCLYLILFYFAFCCFCFQKFHPPWYQMVHPYPYSITQMMVDITSSTILNSRAIQWKSNSNLKLH